MSTDSVSIRKHPAIPFIIPFAAFVILLGLRESLPIAPRWEYPVRVLVVSALVLWLSLRAISWRPDHPLTSALIGVLVFGVWIGPDVLWPSYRNHWIFQNSLFGTVTSSLPDELMSDYLFLSFRVLGSALLVPVIEELFWRGWLIRYIIDSNFQKVPLGAYSSVALWISAILFATEHGPFWDVGLLAGLIYNFWVFRTRNLADCMIAHGTTNACLAVYVIQFNQWQYWL
jgi:uncharacterized protein